MYVYFKRKTRLREDSGMSEYKHYKTHKTSLVCEHVCVCTCFLLWIFEDRSLWNIFFFKVTNVEYKNNQSTRRERKQTF